MQYPDDRQWFVRVGRFLNVLDPDANMLSPVRVQAWVSTVAATATMAQDFLTSHVNAIQSGASLLWAALAHATHLADKRLRRPPDVPISPDR